MLLAAEPALLPSRILMAFTLACHILLVPLGVALPTLTLIMEAIGIFRRDATALKIARRWSVVMAVQFAVGAVTGTILSFEFGILWPKMLGRFGAAFGLGFSIEAVAFFLEAVFISIYLYGWRRLPPRLHPPHRPGPSADRVAGRVRRARRQLVDEHAGRRDHRAWRRA